MKEPRQPLHGRDEPVGLDAVKLDDELIDLLEHPVGRKKKRIPLRAFDIDLEHQALVAIAILRDLRREGIERAAILFFHRRSDAFGVKLHVPVRARRLTRVEAVVLVHPDLQLARDVTAPLVVPGDSVGVSRLHRCQEVRADKVPAVVRLAEPFERAVRQFHRPQQREQPLAEPLVARRTALAGGARRVTAHQHHRRGGDQHERDDANNPQAAAIHI